MDEAMSEVLLSLKHISKNFGEGNVLMDVSLDVQRGEFVTLLGASGCGKTTTLRIVSGLETPDTVSCLSSDSGLTRMPMEEISIAQESTGCQKSRSPLSVQSS